MKVINSKAGVDVDGSDRTVYFEATIEINNEQISIDGDFSYYKYVHNGFNDCNLDIHSIQDLTKIKSDISNIEFTVDPNDGDLHYFKLGQMFEDESEWDKHFN